MNKLELTLKSGESLKVNEGTSFYEFMKENNIPIKFPFILAKIDEDIFELNSPIEKEGKFELMDISTDMGMSVYIRSLQFVLIKAVYDIFPEASVTIEHSLGKGIFGEVHKEEKLNEGDILRIKNRMQEIINADIHIEKVSINKGKAIEIFKKYSMYDKVRLLNHLNKDTVSLYRMDGRYDYFYGPMAYSTGILKLFDLIYYNTGVILRFPTQDDINVIPTYEGYSKLAKIFYETEQWGKILHVGDVGALNDKVENGDIINMVRVAEALHEKKIAIIADKIHEREKVKIVLIAGPSSSGKTTFSRRLGIQLRVNGLMPIPISLDDYFVDRDDTPKDENGEYDFESIEALDLKLFNEHLNRLLKGEEVKIPTFNFKVGKREWLGNTLKVPNNGILVVEGIHGLNEMLTSTIPKENKFKIYISALTQLNIDNHNRIATTDVRKIRRMVRDYLSRGYAAEETLAMWPSIKRGEEKNIFVFQEEADIMFNSTLVYELCILKKYALEQLSCVKPNSPVYYEALRLKSFLKFFKDLDGKYVPDNSILREFIGGSCFYEY
ncbi:nucleoside kinase [Clostridium sp. KNHs214]|uniref:nucleoside kinase n=1 Tax=Clostridium sp. KNHs214 TaxID=1540257 RepID=UPI00054EE157|nr:nucleoside kinase [Clostridium sp. KNHs214]